jgi:uncharacterized membrane protein YgcG
MINTFYKKAREYAVRVAPLGFFVAIFLYAYSAPEYVHSAEVITSFRSDVTVLPQGTVTVIEEIEYVFDTERHGIFREIPLRHPEAPSSFLKERTIAIELVDVRMDGEVIPYALESGRGLLKVRIGDPAQKISGTHTFTLTYTMHGGLSYPESQNPELYFNVTGSGWQVPILHAEAVVRADGLMRPERACYRGISGARGSCAIRTEGDGVVIFSTESLASGEGMTIAQSLDHTSVARDVRERVRLAWFLIPLLLIAIGGIGTRIYRYKTEHRTDAPIIAQYEPYPGVKPMYAGLLMDRRLDPHDVTAGVVYLAREGYLSIRHLERTVFFFFEVSDYEITLTRSIQEAEGLFEQALLVMLFDDRSAPIGKKISLNDLKKNHTEAQKNYQQLQDLRSQLRTDLIQQGFVASFAFTTFTQPRFIVGIVLGALIIGLVSGLALTLIVFGCVIVALVLLDGRRTRKGYEALDHLRGFKEFLSVTEKERYTFHNAPERNAEQFMEYLPYAIAFGVEKEWAEAFAGVTIPNPAWYDGGSGVHAFSAVGMSESIGAFSSSLAASGTSASSGGGSSGGGSGGGGGGSW